MRIFVCVKQVPDTSGKVAVNEDGTLNRASMETIINPDDLSAMEAALELKDATGCQVTAVTMGPMPAESMLRELIAMGADDGILISGREFGGSDTFATSQIIAAAINTIGVEEDDIVFCGRQAIDGDTAQVGPQIAEQLHIPQVSYAEELKVEGNAVVVKRQFEDQAHMLKVEMPCLVTALTELNEARYMSVGGIVDAYNKPVTVWGFDDLKDDLNPEFIGLKGSPTNVFQSFGKQLRAPGVVLNNLSADEAVEAIMKKLIERHII